MAGGAERRINPFDGSLCTYEELEMWAERVDLTPTEVQEYWRTKCIPMRGTAAADDSVVDASPAEAKDAAAMAREDGFWQRVFTTRSLRGMWTAADAGHIHATSGIAYMVFGAFFLVSMVAHDLSGAGGSSWAPYMPTEMVVGSMALGLINAASGLQPTLLAPTLKDLWVVLGLGPDGNLKSGGFVNASLFYCILIFQSLRVLPSFGAVLAPLDPAVGLAGVLGLLHARLILNAWADRGQLSRFAADPLFAPSLLNLPVSFHLLTEGQVWVEQLAARHPGWSQFFFASNYALAWALSAVTLVLSLYERRVISPEMRWLLVLGVPVLVFAAIVLHATVLMPEWFHGQWAEMLTLTPPTD